MSAHGQRQHGYVNETTGEVEMPSVVCFDIVCVNIDAGVRKDPYLFLIAGGSSVRQMFSYVASAWACSIRVRISSGRISAGTSHRG